MNISSQRHGTCHTESTQIICSFPEKVFDEFESVIGDINDFLQNFCDRFGRISSESPASQSNFTVHDDSAGAREAWETKRLLAEQQIREQVELLTSAWLRLEEEQRTLNQMKKGLAVELSSQAKKYTVGGAVSPMQCLPGNSHLSAKTEQSAVYEFERLKREIQSSRPSIKPN